MVDILPLRWHPRIRRPADVLQAELFADDLRYGCGMAMPELDGDELAAVIAAVKEKLALEPYPLAPRLEPLRSVLAKLDPSKAPRQTPDRAPLPEAPPRSRVGRRTRR